MPSPDPFLTIPTSDPTSCFSPTLQFVGLAVLSVPVIAYSSANERRPIAPAWKIPSQSWCAHAKVCSWPRRGSASPALHFVAVVNNRNSPHEIS